MIKFAVCQLKLAERDTILAGETETYKEQSDAGEGAVGVEKQRPKAITVRFLTQMVELLEERAPKNWRKFDSFLEIFYSLMVHSPEDILKDKNDYDMTSVAYQTGVELYFKQEMIRYLGDFIL